MPRSIFQLKITLEDIRPPIWRRVLVVSTMKLDELHLVIQSIMPWQNYHLHSFESGQASYMPLMPDDDLFDFGTPSKDEAKVRVNQVLTHEKSWIRYTYDMGDGWQHKIVLEKILAPDPKLKYPICIKGKRACPPEDCGGAWGYMDLLEILADPSHPDYAEMMEYHEDGIDAEAFDLAEINESLSNYKLGEFDLS
jgi:Plasmid pRiA4b ORF-3-like protein